MEKDLPLVSVIMPAYNCEAFIEQAIDSVLQQTYPNWELLVADDSSSDNTRAIIDGYSDVRIIKTHNQVNEGNIRTRNRLFAEAKGEFLTVLDADDWISKDKLRTQVSLLQSDKSLNGCVTGFYSIDTEERHTYQKLYNSPFKLCIKYLLNKESMEFPPASILIRRHIYNCIGGLHMYFDRLYAEDKYWIFLIVEKFDILFIPEPLYFYRVNPQSLTNNIGSSLRKLVVTDLVKELLRQRATTGNDWLSDGEFQAAKAYERKLLNSREWISEKYRTRAARLIDMMKTKDASTFIRKAFVSNPYNIKCWTTLLYWVRKHIQSLTI